jgi:hypothetical protein
MQIHGGGSDRGRGERVCLLLPVCDAPLALVTKSGERSFPPLNVSR